MSKGSWKFLVLAVVVLLLLAVVNWVAGLLLDVVFSKWVLIPLIIGGLAIWVLGSRKNKS